MLIFPLGHEDMVVRRWPWITIALIGLNCTIFLMTSRLDSPGERLAAERASQALEYYRDHGYLHLKSPLGSLAREGESAPQAAASGAGGARCSRGPIRRGTARAVFLPLRLHSPG
jgi:hypothetical protein